jgi:hypothetical protein
MQWMADFTGIPLRVTTRPEEEADTESATANGMKLTKPESATLGAVVSPGGVITTAHASQPLGVGTKQFTVAR